MYKQDLLMKTIRELKYIGAKYKVQGVRNYTKETKETLIDKIIFNAQEQKLMEKDKEMVRQKQVAVQNVSVTNDDDDDDPMSDSDYEYFETLAREDVERSSKLSEKSTTKNEQEEGIFGFVLGFGCLVAVAAGLFFISNKNAIEPTQEPKPTPRISPKKPNLLETLD